MTIENLAFSGGGIKGYAYTGVVKYLEDKGMLKDIKKISCTSIGSFIGMLITVGYNYKEILNIVYNIDLSFLEDIKIKNILEDYGLNSGNKIYSLISYFLKFKGFKSKVSFKELFDITGIQLIITCTDIETFEQKIFDYTRTPDYSVILACKYSMTLPLVWKLDKMRYIDGCFSRNLPIEVLPVENTIGFSLVKDPKKSEVSSIQSYIKNTLSCLLHKGNLLELSNYKLLGYNVINIPVHTDSTQLNISKQDIDMMVESGYNSCKDFK